MLLIFDSRMSKIDFELIVGRFIAKRMYIRLLPNWSFQPVADDDGIDVFFYDKLLVKPCKVQPGILHPCHIYDIPCS